MAFAIALYYKTDTVWVYIGTNGVHVDEVSPFSMPGAGYIYSTSKISCEFLYVTTRNSMVFPILFYDTEFLMARE